MAEDSAAEGFKKVSVIHTPCHYGRRHHGYDAGTRNHNLCMIRGPYNPHHVWCGASHQRDVGAGNGASSAGAAAALGALGRFGFIILRTGFGGGAAG